MRPKFSPATGLMCVHQERRRETTALSTEPVDPPAHGVSAVHCYQARGRPLRLGACAVYLCRPQRRPGWPARPHSQAANRARAISGPHCRQASAQHDVPGALDPAQNSVEVHVLVFSRDISILSASVVLYAIAGLRDFRPSIFGKVNTFAQVAAVFFVMLFELDRSRWVWITRTTFLHATLAFTIVSGLHYVFVVGQRLLAHSETPAKSAARQRA